MITFTPYTPEDKNSCLRIFRSNVPDFFSRSEEGEFLAFLDRRRSAYFTLKDSTGDILACGGFRPQPDGISVRLRWSMVDNRYHGQGLGKILLYARLALILEDPRITRIFIVTNQISSPFYQKFGFQVVNTVPNGIAPGFDEVTLDLILNDERREWINLRWQAIQTLMQDFEPNRA